MSTLVVYPDPNVEVTSVDGYAQRQVAGDSWSDLHNGAGTSASDLASFGVAISIAADATAYLTLRRPFFLFDTSSIGSGQAVSACTLQIWCSGHVDNDDYTPTYNVYSSSPASNTAIVSSDYANVGTTAYASDVTQSTISSIEPGYATWTFTATGIAAIAMTGISKFCLRNNYDATNTDPGKGGRNGTCNITIRWAEQAGTDNDPVLTVTYAPPGSSRFFLVT